MIHRRFVLLLLFAICTPINGSAKSTHVWDKNPIPVDLVSGKERRLDFPEPVVDLQVTKRIREQSRIQITPDGSVYWEPKVEWESVRVNAVTVTGKIYLLNVTSGPEGRSDPLIVIDPAIGTERVEVMSDVPEPPPTPAAAIEEELPIIKRRTPDMVDLARYAAQHFYGPERLVSTLEGVERFPVKSDPVRLQAMAGMTTMPVAQWMAPGADPYEPGGDLYVTAVKVQNLSGLTVELDPRSLRGEWLFAAAHHTTLGPRGSQTDRSFWYLISPRSFNESLSGFLRARAMQ